VTFLDLDVISTFDDSRVSNKEEERRQEDAIRIWPEELY
jgi:hypothetical protein